MDIGDIVICIDNSTYFFNNELLIGEKYIIEDLTNISAYFTRCSNNYFIRLNLDEFLSRFILLSTHRENRLKMLLNE